MLLQPLPRALTLALLPLILASHTPHRRHHRHGNTLVAREYAGQGFDQAFNTSSTAAAPSSSSIALASSSAESPTTSSAAVLTTSAVSSAVETTSSTQDVVSSAAVTTAASTLSTIVSSATSTSVAILSSAASTAAASSSLSDTPFSSALSSSTSIASSAAATVPTTVLVASSQADITSTVTQVSSPAVVTTVQSTASASASAAADTSSSSTSGLSKPALVAIIVVASVVGAVAIGWTAFRKWKLKPSNRFDDPMKPIDFSPRGGADDFLEKTLHRSVSNSSVDRQRQQLAAELDDPNPNHVTGIPEHDFTAGPAVGNQVYDTYHQDPYYHAEAYEYQPYPAQTSPHAYPSGQYAGYAQPMAQDYPTQDSGHGQEGYADLQRGNSLGSGSGHGSAHGHGSANGHGSATGHGQTQGGGYGSSHGHGQVFPNEFPSPEDYLGRPTGGNEGPYAQAALYRGM